MRDTQGNMSIELRWFLQQIVAWRAWAEPQDRCPCLLTTHYKHPLSTVVPLAWLVEFWFNDACTVCHKKMLYRHEDTRASTPRWLREYVQDIDCLLVYHIMLCDWSSSMVHRLALQLVNSLLHVKMFTLLMRMRSFGTDTAYTTAQRLASSMKTLLLYSYSRKGCCCTWPHQGKHCCNGKSICGFG